MPSLLHVIAYILLIQQELPTVTAGHPKGVI